MSANTLRIISLSFIAATLAPMLNAQSLQEILDRVIDDSRKVGEPTPPILREFAIQTEVSNQAYFPGNALEGIKLDWYLGHFQAMNEKSLYSEGCEFDRCLRFTWLRTFHVPISIRMEFPPESEPYLYFKQTDGLGGYEPGEIDVSAETQLAPGSERILESLIQNILESEEYTRAEIQGYDGARWIVEFRDRDSYVFADQWSPGRGEIFELGTQLLEWSEFRGAKRAPVY